MLEMTRRRPDARVVGRRPEPRDARPRRGEARPGSGRAPGAAAGLVNAPAEALPFADGRFDGAMIGFGIRNVPTSAPGSARCAACCAPEGGSSCWSFSTPPSRSLWRLYNWYFYNVLPRVGGLLTGQERAYRYLTDTVSEFPDAATFATAMEECGFASVSWRALTGGIVCVHTGVRSTSVSTTGVSRAGEARGREETTHG